MPEKKTKRVPKRIEDLSPNQSDPFEAVRQAVDIDPRLKKVIDILSLQTEILLEGNKKRILLDGRIKLLESDIKDFTTSLRREVYNSPNLKNPKESSVDYQVREGLTSRQIDLDNDTGDGNVEIVLLDPDKDELFHHICVLFEELCPQIKQKHVYKFLLNFKI